MCKQNNYDKVTKIYEILIKHKNFDTSLSEIIKKYSKNDDNEIYIINEVIKKLSDSGYEIVNINPLKIKEI